MTAPDALLAASDRDRLVRLGVRLRGARRRQKVTAVAAAEAAGLSRVTLHRIERGEATVAMASWLALASALGLEFELVDPAATVAEAVLPERIALADAPQLRRLAWQLDGVDALTPREALDLYERNWRHVDVASLTPQEAELIRLLSSRWGGGRLLV